MNQDISILSELIFKYLQGELTVEESLVLQKWKEESKEHAALFEALTNKGTLDEGLIAYAEASESKSRVKQKLEASLFPESQPLTPALQSADTLPGKVHFLRTAWFKYAAAILILFGTVVFFWMNTRNDKELTTTKADNRLQTDIPPGGDRAVLTLADGSKIILDKAANGNLAQQGNAQVVKLSNGQIVYDLKGVSGKDVGLNTLTTPAGGQYQVTLPDGTKAWLNAASSITYPTAFIDKERSVKISGEVYFEVTSLRLRSGSKVPFIVDVDGRSLVEVLGTSFNINSYANEESIKTTLLEGSVRIANRQSAIVNGKPSDQSVVTLEPGEQAVLSISSQSLKSPQIQVQTPDLGQVMAWKNGLFNFNGSDVPAVMKQLERWYDIKVKYEGAVPRIIFRGEMDRKVHLSDVLEFFTEMGLQFRMDGRTLIVHKNQT